MIISDALILPVSHFKHSKCVYLSERVFLYAMDIRSSMFYVG